VIQEMPTVCFVRHAESRANAGERTSQPAQVELTAVGWKQAEYVASAFVHLPSLVVTSPYVRTKQTAAFTLERFAQVVHEEWLVQEFTYLAPGRCVNLTPVERRPMVQDYWERNDPKYVDGEGAESFERLIERVDDTLQRLRQNDHERIAVFSHGQFMRAVLWRLLSGRVPVTPSAMKQFRGFLGAFSIPNGGIVDMWLGDDTGVWIRPATSAHIPPELITA
jgi:probable phosphoglycerate mutase